MRVSYESPTVLLMFIAQKFDISGLVLIYPHPWHPWALPPSPGQGPPRPARCDMRLFVWFYLHMHWSNFKVKVLLTYCIVLDPPYSHRVPGCWCPSWLVPGSLCYFGGPFTGRTVQSLWRLRWRPGKHLRYLTINRRKPHTQYIDKW